MHASTPKSVAVAISLSADDVRTRIVSVYTTTLGSLGVPDDLLVIVEVQE